MPVWGRRQSYVIVVSTTVIVVGVFTAAALLRPLIPDPEPNPVTARRGDFMALATKQLIKWRTLEDRPFAEAKRTDRLLFLYVGCAWNWSARLVDKNVLVETEIAERLNREFIPVRIDASVRPEWESGPVPLMSAATGIDPGFYMLVTRPDGTPLAWAARQDGTYRFELQTLQTLLSSAVKQSEALDRNGKDPLADQSSQEQQFLRGVVEEQGSDLEGYALRVVDRAGPRDVLTQNGLTNQWPWEWRFLLSTGMTPEASVGLQTIAQSSLVDWIHGGVFRTAVLPGIRGVRYDKLAVQNAEMAATMAVWWAKSRLPVARVMAESLFDAVTTTFLGEEDVFSYEWADIRDQGREPGHSVRPRLMDKHFSPKDRAWMAQHLDLRPKTNPAMVPRIVNLEHYVQNRAKYGSILRDIRRILPTGTTNLGGPDLANNVAGVAARMCEAARILGDEVRLKRALDLMPRVWRYQVGIDGVSQSLRPSADAIAFLGDYLALADAALQCYLSTGDTERLEMGSRVLKRAVEVFTNPLNNAVGSIPPEREAREAPWVSMPNVVDGSQGSLIGAYVRLCQAYSLLLGDTPEGTKFRRVALSNVSRYAPLTKKLSGRLGSLACSMLAVTWDSAVFAVGDNAVTVALRLSQSGAVPLIAPLKGSVRRDVQSRGPGVWLSSRGEITGPFSEDEARRVLRRAP